MNRDIVTSFYTLLVLSVSGAMCWGVLVYGLWHQELLDRIMEALR